VPQYRHKLNCIMFGQLHEGLMAVPNQFLVDLVIVKCFNCSWTDRIRMSVFLLFLYRFCTAHALMTYTSVWNTVVYWPRLNHTSQPQYLYWSWSHICTRLVLPSWLAETCLSIHFCQGIWSWKVCYRQVFVSFGQSPSVGQAPFSCPESCMHIQNLQILVSTDRCSTRYKYLLWPQLIQCN
jgi:hypothetical protein